MSKKCCEVDDLTRSASAANIELRGMLREISLGSFETQ